MVVKKYDTAKVSIFGKDVGALARNSDTGIVSFEYFEEWLKGGFAISHKLPLMSGVFSFPNLSYPTYKGLPAAFADTLPDDFGNAVINAWLARQGRDPQSFSALERLLYAGTRGMGALEYTPALAGSTKTSSEPLEIDSLVVMAQSVLDQRNSINETIHNDDANQALSGIVQVGTSAGGARAKAVIAVNAERTQFRSGQVNCPEGFEHFLIKFDGVVERSSSREVFGDPKGFGLMEYAYYKMAQEAGINISYCELFRENGRAHFMTKRFDRIGNDKMHYQSLCAMDHADFKKPGAYSYEELFTLLRTLKLDRVAALETFRRMVFNVMARNHDDHTKNWGFIINEQKKWTLAPAFDLAYSYKPDSPWVDSHQMSINGKRDHFAKQDLMGVLPESLREEGEEVMKKVHEAVLGWRRIATNIGVESSFIDEIEANHRLSFI